MRAKSCPRKRREAGEYRLSSYARPAKLRAAGAASATLGKFQPENTGMAMQLGHVHIKTGEDPQNVAKFYIDNFGATVKQEIRFDRR